MCVPACLPVCLAKKRDGDGHTATTTCRGQDTPPPRHEPTRQRAGGAGKHCGISRCGRIPPRRTCRGTPRECCGTASCLFSAREERARVSEQRASAEAQGRIFWLEQQLFPTTSVRCSDPPRVPQQAESSHRAAVAGARAVKAEQRAHPLNLTACCRSRRDVAPVPVLLATSEPPRRNWASSHHTKNLFWIRGREAPHLWKWVGGGGELSALGGDECGSGSAATEEERGCCRKHTQAERGAANGSL